MEAKEIKQELINAIDPPFNRPAGELKWIYEPELDTEVTRICTMGNRTILGIKQERHDDEFDGLFLTLLELRETMGMLEATYQIIDNKVTLEPVHTCLLFPIDEDDEDEVLKEFQDLLPQIDLDKIKTFTDTENE